MFFLQCFLKTYFSNFSDQSFFFFSTKCFFEKFLWKDFIRKRQNFTKKRKKTDGRKIYRKFFLIDFFFKIYVHNFFPKFLFLNFGLQFFHTPYGIFVLQNFLIENFCMYKFVFVLCTIILYIKFIIYYCKKLYYNFATKMFVYILFR